MIEAQKQVYAVRRDRKRVLARARDLISAPRPVSAPTALTLDRQAETDKTTKQPSGGDPACMLSP